MRAWVRDAILFSLVVLFIALVVFALLFLMGFFDFFGPECTREALCIPNSGVAST